jgi:hypothetical protein
MQNEKERSEMSCGNAEELRKHGIMQDNAEWLRIMQDNAEYIEQWRKCRKAQDHQEKRSMSRTTMEQCRHTPEDAALRRRTQNTYRKHKNM